MTTDAAAIAPGRSAAGWAGRAPAAVRCCSRRWPGSRWSWSCASAWRSAASRSRRSTRLAIVTDRLFGHRPGPDLVARGGDDRVGPARSARPDLDGRWHRPGRRRRHASRGCSATRSPTRTCSGPPRAPRWGRRSPSSCRSGSMVLGFGLLHVLAFLGALASILHGLSPVTDRWLRAADQPAADRLCGRLAPGRGPGDGDVPVGRGAAPDLLVPARRLRHARPGRSSRRRCRWSRSAAR